MAELKLQADQQVPNKTIKHCKAKPRTLKDVYKKANDNNIITGTAPMTCPLYNLGTRDLTK